MNVSKLKKDMIIKNYKELCALLKLPIKAGNAKKSQLKEMERFFKYSKIGHSFHIEKIYDKNEIQPIYDNRGRKSIYGDMVQVLLMDKLGSNKGRLIISKSKLTKTLGLVNDNYSLGYSNQELMSRYLNIDNSFMKDFFETSNNNLSAIINNALKGLEDKSVIQINHVLMISKSGKLENTVAQEDDRIKIQEIERMALNKLGLIDKNFENRNHNYYKFKKLKNELLKKYTDINFYYNAMDIVVNNKFINEVKNNTINYIIKDLNKSGKIKELNDLFSDNLIKNANNRHLNFSNSSEKMLLVRFSEKYVSSFESMTNSMVRLNAPIISKSNLIEYQNKSDIDVIEQLPF